MASDEDLKAEIERLRAENEALKKPARGQMSLKVSEKGGLSVYGLNSIRTRMAMRRATCRRFGLFFLNAFTFP